MPGLSLPLHQVVVAGHVQRVEVKIGANATAAKMIAGALVILDTTENEVKEAGAKAHGILGIIDIDPTHDIGVAYAVGDNATIIVPGQGAFVALTLLANENVVQGDRLVTAANGLVAKQAVGAMGAQGDIVGLCWDTSNVAADTRIIVLWNYTAELAAAA